MQIRQLDDKSSRKIGDRRCEGVKAKNDHYEDHMTYGHFLGRLRGRLAPLFESPIPQSEGTSGMGTTTREPRRLCVTSASPVLNKGWGPNPSSSDSWSENFSIMRMQVS